MGKPKGLSLSLGAASRSLAPGEAPTGGSAPLSGAATSARDGVAEVGFGSEAFEPERTGFECVCVVPCFFWRTGLERLDAARSVGIY